MTTTIEVDAPIDEMVEAGTLTARQGEVLALLVEGLNATETAERLDVSRNGVYGQITALKQKGILPADYTPSGELRIMPRDRDVRRPSTLDNETVESHLEVIRELVTQQRMFLQTIQTLNETIAALTEKSSE